ncbi:tRNA glutamyl-Q(34) synthetase GluQRS [Aquimixticola soesokkakensis]|uniref:tRNA glutamyl-Q(34) synthetase GluQRS n=1 Tax=Aquimixticola soesokkakensis TaxID=1519096 RepID=UPI000A2710F1
MITRFAPSPTGPLHLGHAFAAMSAFDLAQAAGGTFLLRIEDIDQSRARPSWETQIFDDLHWLGLDWPKPVLRQSDNLKSYAQALDKLWDLGLLYPCTCTRRDIREASRAPQEGQPAIGPDGMIYPGTCRAKSPPCGPRPQDATLRIDVSRATQGIDFIHFTEMVHGVRGPHTRSGAQLVKEVGDIVLARRDMATSYHLSVVVDDAAQGITDVTRGADLFEATQIHVLLQRVLDLPTPRYHHHPLIRDASGKRLAKRDDARALELYRAQGLSPRDIRTMVGLG